MSSGTGDQAARSRIADEHGTSFFVEAGAGTGKTTELIARIRNLVSSGGLSDPSQLAAITFTEAAAAELRARVRDDLEAAARTAEGLAHDRLVHALDHLDDAAITTLHGFALRLLSERPLEVGLPPVVSVQGPIEAALDLDQRVRRLVDHLYAEDEALLSRALRLGLKASRIGEVARAFDSNIDRLAPLAGVEDPPPPAVDTSALLAALDLACAHLPTCADPSDKLHEYLSREISDLRQTLRLLEGDEDGLLSVLGNATISRSTSKGRAPNWGGADGKKEVIDSVARAADELDRLVTALRQDVITRLASRVARAMAAEADLRRRSGRLEFADLLVLARDLVRDHPEVRADLAERYPFLFVDEFQDTDPLQAEIVAHLAAADAHHGQDRWEDIQLGHGRIFVVGDPKQSIYRFRRADIAVFERAKEVVGQRVVLSRNHRTVPSILAWVNAVFGALIGEGIPEAQPGYLALDAARDELGAGGGPAVHLLGGPLEVDRVAQAREQAAADVVATVQGMKAGSWPVGTADGGTRAIEYGDIALLVPTRTPLAAVEAELQAQGVPYRIESRSLVWATDAVRDVLTILEAVDDPSDAVAVVAALRNPALACSDTDLRQWRSMRGRWDPRDRLPEGADEHPVAQGLTRLRRLHDQRRWQPVGALVQHVVTELRLIELTTAHRRPRDHWRRLRFVVDQARAFTSAGGSSLGEFVRWARTQEDAGGDAIETVVPEPDDDAVRILTIHGSKGLEFPAVVLAGLDVKPETTTPAVLWGPDGAEVKVGPSDRRFSTAGYDQLVEREKVFDQAERIRLLYVAATRARDHLVLGLHHKAGERCPAATLLEASQAVPELSVVLDPRSLPAPGGGEHTKVPSPPAGWDLGASWQESYRRRQQSVSRPLAAAPSTIASEMARGAGDAVVAGDAPPSRLPVGRGGTAVGRAVHAVLQVVDLADPTDLDQLAVVAASAEGIGEQAEQIAKLARSLVLSPPVQEAVAGGRYWREVFVAAPVGGRLVEGYIDLLYEAPDGLVVVDHKTDKGRSRAELEGSAADYRGQAAAYAAALEVSLGQPVARACFLFARATEAVVVPIDDVPAAVAEVSSYLAGT